MTEADTRAELIDPAIAAAGWVSGDAIRIAREYTISIGRLQGAGRRTRKQAADYVLFYRDQALAVIEAKKRDLDAAEGVAQAKDYANKLGAPFAFATNGDELYRIDMRRGVEGVIEAYPTPEELWLDVFGQREAREQSWRERFAAVPFEDKSGQWQPRYYQHAAITKALGAIAEGSERILLTLATGTGKTAIAFQIAWKLFHSRWNRREFAELPAGEEPTRRPRILFLADRNVLANQAFNSFSAFADDALVRIDPAEIRKRGRAPKNGSIFFTIFQTFMTSGADADAAALCYEEYPPDFFDLIIIDECHRGGANDESSWQDILKHFGPAVQLGLTATPKRRDNVDTYAYFGEPVYVYSLKDGINDGFLTPFKVKQIQTTLDDYIYTPDDDVLEGEVEQGRRYEERDFNRIIEIKEREAARVKLFLSLINQREKTIVFCANQAHAAAVRDLINQHAESSDPFYCCRVTAHDGKFGEEKLRDFQDNERTIPTILTTSQKLSTGVDARNVRNIVLMRPVNSMIEFKQIIGRGTRLYDGKDFSTIYDFVKAYHHFSDPEWDGEPIDPETPEPKPGPKLPQPEPPEPGGVTEPTKRKPKVKIKLADGKERTVQHMMMTSYWSPDGTPVSAQQFIEQLFGALPQFFQDEQQLRDIWGRPDTREQLLEQLETAGYGREQLSELADLIEARHSDLFDVLAYVAYTTQPETREERVDSHRTAIFEGYSSPQQEFIDFVLNQYVQNGVETLAYSELKRLLTLKYHSPMDAPQYLGPVSEIRELFSGFQHHLYQKGTVA
ncbi:EcoAI/FtnUII family type I restriction enzme subunit R [Cerasicoccus fimbriatus]|uniref:EcoAI/FtnUII family type I restriction enzme subunit R n=1 Tax=Cerasicoccus fimbriatus TaxID=3014554 RepID=UPI0022B46983|nr:type I restriction endonuclease subunit R [Cerasicoccus sp. TK19100]